MNPNDGNWCCLACGKDSGIPTKDELPKGWVILECYDVYSAETGKRHEVMFEILVCRECNPKEE